MLKKIESIGITEEGWHHLWSNIYGYFVKSAIAYKYGTSSVVPDYFYLASCAVMPNGEIIPTDKSAIAILTSQIGQDAVIAKERDRLQQLVAIDPMVADILRKFKQEFRPECSYSRLYEKTKEFVTIKKVGFYVKNRSNIFSKPDFGRVQLWTYA